MLSLQKPDLCVRPVWGGAVVLSTPIPLSQGGKRNTSVGRSARGQLFIASSFFFFPRRLEEVEERAERNAAAEGGRRPTN